jgi:hypothetical protein
MQRLAYGKSKIRHITRGVPAGHNYVLVEYGQKYAQTRRLLGLTTTVARQQSKTPSELSLLTAVRGLERRADAEAARRRLDRDDVERRGRRVRRPLSSFRRLFRRGKHVGELEPFGCHLALDDTRFSTGCDPH